MTSMPVSTPAANPLVDLLQDDAFLDLVVERQRVSMADLPDVLRILADSGGRTDGDWIRELYGLVSRAVRSNAEIASRATFAIFPERAWRDAQERLPLSAVSAPDDMVWAESGFRREHAVVAPNTDSGNIRLMLYDLVPVAAARSAVALVPVEFHADASEAPASAPPECVLDWLDHGEYSALECLGQCETGTCTPERYHARGRPEVVSGCYCC
jgi:hypothetical protein